MVTIGPSRTPWHLWAVGLISLLWNDFGAFDYTMSELGSLNYFQAMGLGQSDLDWIKALPAWVVAGWAIGVWGSVLGSVLLLARSRHAVTAFLASLAGALISFAYQFSITRPATMTGSSAVMATVVILLAILAQWFYARRMVRAGVLH